MKKHKLKTSFLDVVKASYRVTRYNDYGIKEEKIINLTNDISIRYYISDTLLSINGISVGGAIKVNIDDVIFIISSRISDNNNLIRTTLAHEYSHYILGHLDKINKSNILKRYLNILMGKVDILELEADRKAAELIGKRKMKNWLIYMINSDLPFISKLELKRRLKEINKL